KRGVFSGARAQARGRKVRFDASIFQKKEEGLTEIRRLLSRVPHKHYTRPTGVEQFKLDPKYVRDLWRRASLDTLSYEEFVLRLGPAERRAFLQAVAQAEGYRHSGAVVITQNEGELAEAIRLAAFLEGYFPTTGSNGEYRGVQNLAIRLSKPFVTGQRLRMEPLSEAPVWCVETELG